MKRLIIILLLFALPCFAAPPSPPSTSSPFDGKTLVQARDELGQKEFSSRPADGAILKYVRGATEADDTVQGATAGTDYVAPIASGSTALGTGAISSGACATVVTATATGVATTDTIIYTPNADPTGVTGYAVSATGSLYIWAYPTANNVNFKVCNNTSGSLTPSALTLNWRVVR